MGAVWDRAVPGDKASGAFLERTRAVAEGVSRQLGPGAQSVPGGTALSAPEPESFDARLSGTGPYTFAEVYGTPGGGWLAVPSGRTGTATDSLGSTGLSGKVVRVTRSEGGDFRFTFHRLADTTCPHSYCVTVTGLSSDAPVEGVTVTLLDSSLAVLDSGSTDADGRWCVTPYPLTLWYTRLSFVTAHGTITSNLFRFLKGGSCDIEESYTLCYGQACLAVTDGTEGGPLSGADVSFGASCANDTFRNPSFAYGPVTEVEPGTYCGLVWRIQPKVRGCTGPIGITAAASKGDCYYGDGTLPFACGPETPCAVTGTFTCSDWSGAITLRHFTPKLRVLIAAPCGAANVTIDVAGVTTESVLVPGSFPARTSGPAGTYHEVDIAVPWPFAASYDVTVTPTTPGYLTPSSQSVAFDCRNGGTVFFDLTLEDLYTCGCCGFPVKKVLHFSDAYGSCVLTFGPLPGLPGQAGWFGSYVYTPADPHEVINVYGNLTCVPIESGSVGIDVVAVCDGQGTLADGTHVEHWTVRKDFAACIEPGPLNDTNPGFLCVNCPTASHIWGISAGVDRSTRVGGLINRACTDSGFSLDFTFTYSPLEYPYNETTGAATITE